MNILQRAEELAKDVETDLEKLWCEFEEFVRGRHKAEKEKNGAAATPQAAPATDASAGVGAGETLPPAQATPSEESAPETPIPPASAPAGEEPKQ